MQQLSWSLHVRCNSSQYHTVCAKEAFHKLHTVNRMDSRFSIFKDYIQFKRIIEYFVILQLQQSMIEAVGTYS